MGNLEELNRVLKELEAEEAAEKAEPRKPIPQSKDISKESASTPQEAKPVRWKPPMTKEDYEELDRVIKEIEAEDRKPVIRHRD